MFYKLSREKPRKYEQLPYYVFCTLLYPFMQELVVKTLSKKENNKFVQRLARHNKPRAKPWRAEPETTQNSQVQAGYNEEVIEFKTKNIRPF